MNRRSALRLGGATLAGALAGCSGLESDEPTAVTVSEIVIRNRLDSEIDVSALLLDAGEVAYWRTVSVPAGSNPFADLTDVPSTSGEYVLYAQLPAIDGERPVHADLIEEATEQSCLRLGMEVVGRQTDGGEIPSIEFTSIGECRDSP